MLHTTAGNLITDDDIFMSQTKVLAWNHAGQIASVTSNSVPQGAYTYDYLHRMVARNIQSGVGTVHQVHDLFGNVIAEYHASGYLMTEYVWLEDRPLAVIADAGGTPRTLWVHTDHLQRPVVMTDDNGDAVWQASYLPFGEVASITGSETLNYRFPGQWFQLEAGLTYNWHRHYDPSTGRYVSPDPLGMPDGPSRYAYVRNSPLMYVDPTGLAEPPGNAWSPNGPKAPGYPGHYPHLNGPLQWPGNPRNRPNWVPNPNPGRGGSSHGWEDRFGNVWCPTGPGPKSEGAPHWDVQFKRGGGYVNVYPPREQENPLNLVAPRPEPWQLLPILFTIGIVIVVWVF